MNLRQRRRPYIQFYASATLAFLLLIISPLPLRGSPISDQEEVLRRTAGKEALPHLCRSEAALAKGKFLVANRNIRDPRFSESVILLIEYSGNGAAGIIINKPTDIRLSHAFPEIEGLKNRADTVYYGGPMETDMMVLLIFSRRRVEGALNVFDDIYASSSRELLDKLVNSTDKEKKFHLYAGYAGWAAMQLDMEISRGDWHVLQADAKTVFERKPSEIWPELIRQSPPQWIENRSGLPDELSESCEYPQPQFLALFGMELSSKDVVLPYH